MGLKCESPVISFYAFLFDLLRSPEFTRGTDEQILKSNLDFLLFLSAITLQDLRMAGYLKKKILLLWVNYSSVTDSNTVQLGRKRKCSCFAMPFRKLLTWISNYEGILFILIKSIAQVSREDSLFIGDVTLF